MVQCVAKHCMDRCIVCDGSGALDVEGLAGGCYAHRGLVIHDNCWVIHINRKLR